MRTLRLLLLFVALTGIAAVAEAQCYQCRNLRPMPWYQGVCIEGTPGVCSSQCCGQVSGTSCSLPDNDLWYCTSYPPDWFAANRYFTTGKPALNNAIALTKKLGTESQYLREAAKRRIPRRCGASA